MKDSLFSSISTHQPIELYRQDGEEFRLVECWISKNNTLVVSEKSKGALTQEVFDEPEHLHQVELSSDAAQALVDSLQKTAAVASASSEAAAQSTQANLALDKVLKAFFTGSDETFLTDFMDMLDVREISYSYLSKSAELLAFRKDA